MFLLRLRRVLFVSILVVIGLPESSALAQPPTRGKEFTINDIFVAGKFSTRSVRGVQWIGSGKAFSYLETDSSTKRTNVWKYDVASGKRSTIVDATALVLKQGDEPLRIQNYKWSPDERTILFTGTLASRGTKSGGQAYLYDLTSKKFTQLTNSDEEQLIFKYSPDGRKVGFVRANNLFVVDLASGKETQLTFDGKEHVLNGHFDWVYEEEFGIIEGWHWSPDSKSIAYWQLDENRVPEFPIIDFLPLHQEVNRMRYPKAGDPNSIVRIGIVSIERATTVWADIGAPFDSTQDVYIPRVAWTNDPNILAVQRLNRHQTNLDLLFVDARTGASRVVLTESDTACIHVNGGSLRFLSNPNSFIWLSERDGFWHIFLYRMDGTLERQLTQGKWEVDQVIGFDERRGIAYFTANIASPTESELYSVKLDGTGFRRVTKEKGSHSINMSPDCSTFLDTYSNANTPPVTTLRSMDGSVVRTVQDGTPAALSEYQISQKTFFTFTTSDGVELNGWMIKPPDFDPSTKYSVLLYVYGGPGSQTVLNAWDGGYFAWNQLLAQKGYILVSIDNRGTGARGRAFRISTYKHLGKWETHDQIEGVNYLSTLPYVDATRIGMWGWSYGGYMTLMALTDASDVFKVGVSVAPVTHWKFYDTIYTVRYMLTPAENSDGYEESAPVKRAGNLRGRLLLIHGTADDNVHWQNSVTMVDRLIKEGKQFETAFYPGGMHGIGGGNVRAQLFTKITNFILQNL
jgi:dipeptidyl-peptidase-4